MIIVERLFPLVYKTIAHEDMDRSTSSSALSDEESRSPEPSSEEKTLANPTPEKRKRHRRGKKRKWKPYSKETRAARTEAETTYPRLPVAPSNTTQFIMEDRGDAAVRIPSPSRLPRSISYDSSPSGDDCWYESPEEISEQDAFLEEDFNQVYAQLRMDRLDHMTKEDLVHQCLDLEQKVFSLQEERDENQAVMEKELAELKEKNMELVEENLKLRTAVPTSAS